MLVIEDEAPQAAALTTALDAHGLFAVAAPTGRRAIELIQRFPPDVVLLDLGLPDIDGVELCRHVRAHLPGIPIIVVTADGADESVVRALDTGADDYVVKPLSMPVLMARVRVALRHLLARAPLLEDRVLTCGDVEIDVASREVRAGGAPIELVARQFDVLLELVRNEGKLLTYAALVRACWGVDDGDDHLAALRTSMSKLRKALGAGPARPVILTQHNIGYRLVAP